MNDLGLLIWKALTGVTLLAFTLEGDYLNLKNIGVLDVDYYTAVEYIRICRKSDFYIFSDDLDWCR